MIPINSVFLDEIVYPILLDEDISDKKINKGAWHLTLCNLKDIDYYSFDGCKIREILSRTTWQWVGVECDSKDFPPDRIDWYHEKNFR
jgi:hypothetical protein